MVKRKIEVVVGSWKEEQRLELDAGRGPDPPSSFFFRSLEGQDLLLAFVSAG